MEKKKRTTKRNMLISCLVFVLLSSLCVPLISSIPIKILVPFTFFLLSFSHSSKSQQHNTPTHTHTHPHTLPSPLPSPFPHILPLIPCFFPFPSLFFSPSHSLFLHSR